MPVKPRKSIEEYGGLRAYLSATRDQHNGLGYKDFLFRINPDRKHKVPKSVIAEDFNVKSAQTIYRWLRIHQSESDPDSDR